MKKLVLLLVVLVCAVPVKAVPFKPDNGVLFDDFNVGWSGPGPIFDPENRWPIGWDPYADAPSNTFMKLGQRATGDLAMVLSQWGSNCGIITQDSYPVAGCTTLNVDIEAKSEGWGWILTLNVKGIFADALGNPLGTVVGSITPLKNTTAWTAQTTTLAVPAGAASAKFVLENYRGPNGENGGLWVDNIVVTPEPMTLGLLGLGALFMRKRTA